MRYKQNQFAHKENEGNEIIFVHFGVAEIEILLYYSLFFDLFTSILKWNSITFRCAGLRKCENLRIKKWSFLLLESLKPI